MLPSRHALDSPRCFGEQIMKCRMFPSCCGCVSLVVSLWLVPCGPAAISVVLTPTAITNDYVGKITLNMAGLAPGQTIRVEQFSDVNADGQVNPGEWLVRSFLATDGQQALLAGVANLNMAGDSDGQANGQIRAEWFYPGPNSPMDQIVGQYLFRVSDPLGGFMPVTTSLQVRQKSYPQGVTGRATAVGTGLPLANAWAVVSPNYTGGGFGVGTDPEGNFMIPCPPGNYTLLVVANGFVADRNAGAVAVSSNTFSAKSVADTAGTFTIAGKLSDSSSGAGLAGVFIQADTTNGLFAGTTTDSDGKYAVRVTGGPWRLMASSGALAQLGYLGLRNRTSVFVGADVSNVNLQVPKASAVIYGRVVDNLNNPLIGLSVGASDNNPNNQYSSSGMTFWNDGRYTLGVQTGTWDVRPDSGKLAALRLVCSGTTISVTRGQALEVNFVASRLPELEVTSLFLPCGTEGSLYSIQLGAANGRSPYVWSLVPGSSPLPSVLSLSANGVFSGTAPAAGTYNLVVRVTDQNGLTADQSLALLVLPRDTGVAPLQWDDRLGVNGLNGPAYALAMSGNNLFVGGEFTTAGGASAPNVGVWNGRSWLPTLGNGVDGRVNALLVIGSDVYAGGAFRNAGSVSTPGIGKFDGAVWSSLGTGMNGAVNALAVTSDGQLYAGGAFTMAGGVSANHVARWDGTNWQALGVGVDDVVQALTAQGTNLYVGGNFNAVGGMVASHVAQWNGSTWSALGSGVNGNVLALTTSGNDLYVGGTFTSAGGSYAMNIAKWTGASWSALGTGVGSPNSSVSALLVSGTNLFAGGNFSTAGGFSSTNVAVWNGSRWMPSPSSVGTLSSTVYAMAATDTGVYAAGNFTEAGGTVARYLARFQTFGYWSREGDGIPASYYDNYTGSYCWPTYALGISGQDVIVGGEGGVLRWDGNSWWVVGNYQTGLAGSVRALAVQGSELYVGACTGPWAVARFNGAGWTSLAGTDGAVLAIAANEANVYVGGQFSAVGTTSAKRIARWDGSNWFPLGSGLDASVWAIAVSGSNVYVGGEFTTAGGLFVNRIARWDGSSWSTLGSGLDGVVSAIAVNGANVYVGGSFTRAGSVSANCIARWDGSSWSALGTGMDGPNVNARVTAIVVNGDEVYAGGWFTTAGAANASCIARWDGSNWLPLGSGMDRSVAALALSGADLYAVGNFTTAGGKSSVNFAHWVLGQVPGASRPILSAPVYVAPNQFQFLLTGIAGQNYTIQFCTNLSAGNWSPLLDTNAPSSPLVVADPKATTSQRYYRAVLGH